jgi:uncharacterized membrane protein YkvA (DUF1232 family)
MSAWIVVAVGAAVVVVVVAVVVVALATSWRATSESDRRLIKRVMKLPIRRKLTLAARLARDRRIPLLVRLVPPALVLYLASPVDVIPDFIPVLGQLDDVVAIVIGVRLLLRYAPRAVIEGHLERLEAPAAQRSDA